VLYTTSTFGILGGEGHASVRAAAISFVRAADRFYDVAAETAEYPYPVADKIRFYLLTFKGVRWIMSLATCLVIAGCGVATQPESARTVAAFEVPLRSEAERSQFLSVLRLAAEAEGMHVDAASSQELERTAKVIPQAEMTLRAAVWRGSNDDEAVASAMDQYDHLGLVWMMFSKGEDPTLTSRFRERAMREIMLRWPNTLTLPIMPTGAIPLHRDLVRMPGGYIVNPSEAHKYQLEPAQKESPNK
jgi:hypothetical protein